MRLGQFRAGNLSADLDERNVCSAAAAPLENRARAVIEDDAPLDPPDCHATPSLLCRTGPPPPTRFRH